MKLRRKRKPSSPTNSTGTKKSGLLVAASLVILLASFSKTNSEIVRNISISISTAMNAASSSSKSESSPTAATEQTQASVSTSTSATTEQAPRRLAYEQSYGLFADVTNEEWKRIRDKVHSQSLYKNPQNPLDKVEDSDYWIENNIFPNFDCPNNMGLGGAGQDGEKFVCNPQRLLHESKTECLVYSIGCAGNYRFEDHLAKLHNNKCEIHVFDPAPKWARPNDPETKNIHYHAWGFLSSYDKESKSNVWPAGRRGGFKTFDETRKELGHENRIIDVFKIDCEGCEWSTYKDWIGRGYRQILVENHGVPTPEGAQNSRWFQKPLNIAEYYDEYKKHGYALFNRDFHGKAVDLAFVKLDQEFWK